MTVTTLAPDVRAVALVDCQVGYAENAFDWYPGDPRRSAVGTAVDWRVKDGAPEVQVRWLVGYTRWERADTLVAICPSAPINANRGR